MVSALFYRKMTRGPPYTPQTVSHHLPHINHISWSCSSSSETTNCAEHGMRYVRSFASVSVLVSRSTRRNFRSAICSTTARTCSRSLLIPARHTFLDYFSIPLTFIAWWLSKRMIERDVPCTNGYHNECTHSPIRRHERFWGRRKSARVVIFFGLVQFRNKIKITW